jgi:hypothetical protein
MCGKTLFSESQHTEHDRRRRIDVMSDRSPQSEPVRPLHMLIALLAMAVPPLAIIFAIEEWGAFGLSGAGVLLLRTSITGTWLCLCALVGLYGSDVVSWWRRS